MGKGGFGFVCKGEIQVGTVRRGWGQGVWLVWVLVLAVEAILSLYANGRLYELLRSQFKFCAVLL